MPWPLSGDNSSSSSDQSWPESAKKAASTFTDTRVLVASATLTLLSLGGIRVYKRYLRRIPSAEHIRPEMMRSKTIFGKVTSVGDGDNFRLYHTPGGRLAGWGWLPGRSVPTRRDELSGQTIHVRLAGVDAPELAHFGRPAQPYGREALEFLTDYILDRRVRARIWRRDQYERVVATVHVRRGFWGTLFRRDVSLEMLKGGFATVYEAKFGSEFGNKEQQYKDAEEKAKNGRIGMWATKSVWDRLMGTGSAPESPREYKTRMAKEQAVKTNGKRP